MDNLPLAEICVKEDEESKDNTVQEVVGRIKNPLTKPVITVLFLIKSNPDHCPTMKLVNLKIPETKNEEKSDRKNRSSPNEEGKDIFCTQITIKVIREYSDGMLSCDVFTI
jgi:hypothetical protein